MEYCIVARNTANDLTDGVNKMMDDEWEVSGSMSVSFDNRGNTTMRQPMIRDGKVYDYIVASGDSRESIADSIDAYLGEDWEIQGLIIPVFNNHTSEMNYFQNMRKGMAV